MEMNPAKVGAPQAGVPPHNIAFTGQNQGAVSGLIGPQVFVVASKTLETIAEVLDRGTTSCAVSAIIYTALACVGVPCIYSCGFRTKLRNLYSLNEGSCGDCCLHCWCDYCAICQECRELKIRGVDPSIGWQGNVQKWNQGGVEMPPAVAPGMYR